MRSLSAAALAKIAEEKGAEPINLIEIQWVPNGAWVPYADRDIGSIPGRILQLSSLDNVVTVSGGGDSQEISITLDDTSGEFKTLFDTIDIHKRPVRVYQWFAGLDEDDKFLLFPGRINSPVVWNETDRTLSFNVITKVEDREIGFSAEEGQFPQIPDDLIGQPWPLAFGTVIDFKALRLTKSVQGTTQQGVGIISGKDLARGIDTGDAANDLQFSQSFEMMNIQHNVLLSAAQDWLAVGGFGSAEGSAMLDQANAIGANMASALAARDQQQQQNQAAKDAQIAEWNATAKVGPSKINILGGEDFPQNIDVEVEIGNGGFFTGKFNCQEFRITKRRHPENEERAQEAHDRATGDGQLTFVPPQNYDVSIQTPRQTVRRRGIILGGLVPNATQVDQIAQFYWADAGSTVKLVSDLDQNYIVSIVPGTVLSVRAYKQFEGIRKLVNVPTDLWEQVDVTYGDISVVTVRLTKQLSGIPEQQWEDEIYVTFESSVGPNTVDIMRYLIETYSDLAIDEDSFDEVQAYLEPFPSNFVITDRPQILNILQDIAFQARCAVFVANDTVFLKYLPVTPDSVQTITLSDVAQESLSFSLTETEKLVTKMVVTWRPTYADDDERKMILRHNVAKYGIQEKTFKWFIYNQPDIIRKAATFWLIRYANTWKRVNFSGYLNLLNVETFDGVTLDFPGLMSTLATVEKATYDSSNNKIEFECWTPLKAGSTTPYPFAWPYNQPGEFPAPGDSAGSDFSVTGDLPVGTVDLASTCPNGGGIVIGGPNIVFRGPADKGDPTPADTGFEAQPMIFPGTDFNLVVQAKPRPDLSVKYRAKLPIPEPQNMPQPTVIDISRTPVVDSARPATDMTFSEILEFDSGSDGYAAKRAFLFDD